MWTVGIDVGGTFTDLFATRPGTAPRTGKVLTTPQDRSQGVIDALRAADLSIAEVGLLVHGTTTATNSLIERSFPEAGMITTNGFRDVIEIGRMHREHLYRPYQTKPAPLIRRRNRHVVHERVTAQGRVERPVDPSEVSAAAAALKAAEVASVVVCLINAYANPANEQAVAEQLRAEMPGVPVVTSAEVKPVLREHSRFSTATVRAVLLPVMAAYFRRLQSALTAEGFAGHLMILKSNGGMMSVDQASERVEELVESGPAGGIGYASRIAEMTGKSGIIHTDMGGTSFDTSIVENGTGLVTRDYEIEFDIPVAVPMLDIRSIGAGGGSIGWIDDGGSLRVGPMSAGSEPGPACYGRGGTLPTVTDANLVLGRLSGDLSGKFALDRDAARTAIAQLSEPLSLTVEDCAEGMLRIATEAMAQAVKIVLASRGRDPRDYALVSFGGAGPMHACAVAMALNTPTVIVPEFSGVASAHGATCLSLKHDEEHFHHAVLSEEALRPVKKHFDALERNARAALTAQGAQESDIVVGRSMQMRYAGQTFEVEVATSRGALESGDLAAIAEAFHTSHKREFGVRSDAFPIEIVALGITAEGPPPSVQVDPIAGHDAPMARGSTADRSVYLNGGWQELMVHAAEALAPGEALAGPIIVEDPHTCVVVPPNWSAQMDDYRNLVLEAQL